MRNHCAKMALVWTILLGSWSACARAQPESQGADGAAPSGKPSALVDAASPGDSPKAVPGAPSDDPPVDSEILVLMKSGRRLHGFYVGRDHRQLALRIGALVVRVPEDQVDRVVRERPAIERYRDMRAVIDDGDVDRLLTLIQWLSAHKLYDAALTELDHVRSLEPDNPDGIRLQRLVEQEVRLQSRSAGRVHDDTPVNRQKVRRAQRLKPGEFPLITPEQANLLKVWEIDLNDPPPLRIDRATVDAFLDRYGDDPSIPTTQEGREAFRRRDPVDILSEMFRLRARDLYGKVEVTGLPASLQMFRETVNSTWLLNNCSTTRCHGGGAGGLLLENRRANAERPTLTNYLILDRSTLSDGRPLIDYENPERSPLLQLGLPRPVSAFPHPAVKGWRPVFRAMDARRFVQAVQWIHAMREPHSLPPIDYSPPKSLGVGKSGDRAEPQPR